MDAERAEEYAKSVGAKHFHTSAKTNKGIEEMFDALTDDMIQQRKGLKQTQSKGQQRKTITLVEDDHGDDRGQSNPEGRKSSKCCGGGDKGAEMPVDNDTNTET